MKDMNFIKKLFQTKSKGKEDYYEITKQNIL